MREVQVQCPNCGDREFGEVGTIECVAGPHGFEREADGSVSPVYTGSTDVEWDSQTPVSSKPYICLNCGNQYELADIEVVVVHKSTLAPANA